MLLVLLQTLEGAAAGLPKPNQSEAVSGRSPRADGRAGHSGLEAPRGHRASAQQGSASSPQTETGCKGAPRGDRLSEESSEDGTTTLPSHDTQTARRPGAAAPPGLAQGASQLAASPAPTSSARVPRCLCSQVEAAKRACVWDLCSLLTEDGDTF